MSQLEVKEQQDSKAHCIRFETLDEDAVKQRDDGLDGPESCLGSL